MALMPMDKPAPGLLRKGAEHWFDARVVAVSGLGEHIQPPEVLWAEPAIRYPVPQHRPSGRTLQSLAGTVDILPEESGRHLPDTAMVEALACHFVTPVRHFSHQ